MIWVIRPSATSASGCWTGWRVGESRDGRQWLLHWGEAQECFLAVGFAQRGARLDPEVHVLVDAGEAFIVRHTQLPAPTGFEDAA
jgi:hypothetical protein